MMQMMTIIATAPAHIMLLMHTIAAFTNSPRVGWVGIAATPFGVAAIVWPLTRKSPQTKGDQPCPK